MRKLILLFALLIGSFAFGQITRTNVLNLKEVTTVQRDALTIAATEFPIIYNTTTNQHEKYNGTTWEKWVVLVDADVAESNVTQHEAALTVTESQISDLTHVTGNATHTGEVTGATALTIAVDAVETTNILNSTITTDDVALNTLTAFDLASESVGTDEIADGSVLTADIGNGTIDETDLDVSVNASLDLADSAIQPTLAEIVEADLSITNAPTDNYLLSYNLAGTNFTWVASSGDGLGADGDKGDITVGGTGTTLSIDSGSIVNADINATADIDASKIAMGRIAGSTYHTAQHWRNNLSSAGLVEGGGITDDTDGTITVATGSCAIRATDSPYADLLFADFAAEAGAPVNLVDNDMNYVYIEYNAGTPQVIATTTPRTNNHSNILLSTIYRRGTGLHITSGSEIDVTDPVYKITKRLQETEPFSRVSGGKVAEIGTRNVSITAGSWWEGLYEFSTSAFDSSVAGTFFYYYADGVGGFTEVTTQTQIDNANYDDGDGTLGTMGANNYNAHWVYMGQDSDVYVLYGVSNGNVAIAQDEGAPATVPPHFDESHARLLAKIITQQGNDSFISVENFNGVTSSPSVATDHGGLIGLGDDDHTQYLLADGTRTLSGNLTITGTVDGRDVAADGNKLDGTGETGGNKFLREDGDGTSSWNTISTTSIDNGTIIAEDLADNSVTEPKLNMFNAAVNGYVLGYDSTNGLQWQADAGGGDIYLHPNSDVAIDSIYVGTAAQIAARPLGTDVLAFATDDVDERVYVVPLTSNGGDVATATNLVPFFQTRAITITDLMISVNVAGTTSVITVDINNDGTSILTNKLTIDATEKTSATAATAYSFITNGELIANGDEFSFDIDTADSGNTGVHLTAYITYTID